MKRAFVIILTALLLAPVALDAAKKKTRTSADARRQRQQTEREMADTHRKLTDAEAGLTRRMQSLDKLQGRIGETTLRIRRLQQRIDSVGRESTRLSDSIAAREAELATLRAHYVKAVRASRRYRREMNSVNFLFSSDNFSQAYRRMRYMEEYSEWKRRKTEKINNIMESLAEQKKDLAELHSHLSALKSSETEQHRSLNRSRDSMAVAVNSLKGETKRLNALLKRQQNMIKSLDDELTRLIAKEEAERKAAEEAARKKAEAEARKKAESASKTAAKAAPTTPAYTETSDKKTTPAPATGSDFASQKGKLPSPLSHTYSVVNAFGLHTHPTLSKVQVDNPGVDLETASGARARAVYPGVVSAVFMQNGYGHVVLLRHGDWLTVYANIETLGVKKGDKLSAGDAIGVVGPSESNSSRGLLHFEIRKEKNKFDPMTWLRK